jgi:putative addiction module component (TIGR02574 family)
MPKTLAEVTRDALELPQIERLKLARIMLDLSEDSPHSSSEVAAAWDREIEDRLEELRSGKVKRVPLEEVQRNIEARFPHHSESIRGLK